MTIEELFEDVIPNKKQAYLPHISHINASVFFEVKGEPGWHLILKNGDLNITKEDDMSGEDCRIIASREVFEEILNGKRKVLSAIMFGKVKIKGNLALAKEVASILQEHR